eukprot:CAMPEP_0172447186 /NCGR_PEP_ID=MMETSP1065-20121228/6543_1 /TAXON_ID=265537 /ORGANISM="Amphiprora paludosa, Strain CCMP125" /LENGTH=532 /DNA_ID=CAMNT_0013198427 /DNA_START=109 /DNA_END=1707 /DNA_ORIENTATION=+
MTRTLQYLGAFVLLSLRNVDGAAPRSLTWKNRQATSPLLPPPTPKHHGTSAAAALAVPRGGELAAATTTTSVTKGSTDANMVMQALTGLAEFVQGGKADTLLLLATTALNTPLCNAAGVSPILGFLALGLLFGPNGRGLISDVHTTEMMADLGIVLFLFEMGIHLDFKTLMSMKRDVFGVGLGQFTLTALVIGAFVGVVLKQSTAAAVIIGWSLALSSSAFVLQLLKDKNQMETQYGKSSFGTLLLQDLMVVPLLVITPILAGGGDGSIGAAIGKAVLSITIALAIIGTFGKTLLNPLLDLVTDPIKGSQEALIGLILAIVLGMSYLTQGLGLSNTLGAFLSGMLIAETKHRHTVEVQAAPFRGILVGLFFFTVGFEIDLKLIFSKAAGGVFGCTAAILVTKLILAALACRTFGELPWSTSQRVGMVLSQGGEFAFVAFRTARSLGILTDDQTRFLLTCVSLTMAVTPFMEQLGGDLALKMETSTPSPPSPQQRVADVVEKMTGRVQESIPAAKEAVSAQVNAVRDGLKKEL